MRVVTGTVLGLSAFPAHAYLDPGSGSLIIQSVIGALAAVGITMKLYWHKIKLKFGGRKSSDPEADLRAKSAPKDPSASFKQ